MSQYVCISTPTEKMVKELEGLAEKAGSALVKSANATREFFRMFPACVGNVTEAQGILSHLDGFADFAVLKKDSDKFVQTFAGLDNALRKGTAEVINKGKVLWRGKQYNHKLALFGIAICDAARKQAGKKGGATVVSKKASREDLARFISELIALCDEHEIHKDKRYSRLLDRWLDMVV